MYFHLKRFCFYSQSCWTPLVFQQIYWKISALPALSFFHLFTKIIIFSHPCLWVETLFFLSLKLLAGQMLAHSRGRQRKIFHPQSWTTVECCDSCFGILNRSQSAVSHLGPAVSPQWSSVLAFLCRVSSPTKITIVVCCIPFCLFMTSLNVLLYTYLWDHQHIYHRHTEI